MTIGEIILDEPCPTCGGEGKMYQIDNIWGYREAWKCPHCGGDGLRHVHADQEKEDR